MNCPHCHSGIEVLEKNYGTLFTCSQCQAVYFINFDGQPEYSDEREPLASSVESALEFSGNGDPLMTSFENPLSALQNETKFISDEGEFSQAAKEISDFGNSDAQISSLNYDVEIKGLDSKEELLTFKESITDRRFGWEVSDIMKRIRNGELILEKLNPVQAFILGKRIHFLNLDVKWKQNVLA